MNNKYKNLKAEQMPIFALIKEDLKTPQKNDPAFHSKWELLFNYPGVKAIVFYRLANRLYKNNFKLLARMIMGIFTSIDIHPACNIGRRVFIDHAKGVVIGETTTIGDDVTIYQGVTLGGIHNKPIKRHPTIKNGVIVGSGAKILGDITIGKDSKIGANSVVIRNVPANSTAVGIPATVLKKDDTQPLDHNNIEDINIKMFKYVIQRICILEKELEKQGIQIPTKEDEGLETAYKKYIKSYKV